MRRFIPLAVVLILATSSFAGTTKIVPTTTYKAETGNNTSAASSFTTSSNGNAGSGNVSKVSIKTMMYPGFNGKMLTHFMGWFGKSNHINVGYSSIDAAQVAAQVTDIESRGYDGLVLDWYGPSHGIEDQVAQLLAAEMPKHPSFTWALTEDAGALKTCVSTSGCDVTGKFISDLTYAWTNYEQMPQYIKINGRPMVMLFGEETVTLDWTRIANSVPGNPVYIWRNAGGFTKPQSGGSFAWINVDKTNAANVALSYLDNVYATALNYPAKAAFGTGYKGFDDSLASWSANRLMNQNCGQTWLTTMAEMSKYYSAANNIYAVQTATWNDYEEGTELESGIDNCVSISAAVNGATLSWTISGNENTIDHYTAFISLDGSNLMPLADVAAGTHTLDLGQYGFAPATYTVYVKSVGKPHIQNHMSEAAQFIVANQVPVAALKITPATGIAPVTVNADTTASTDSDGTVSATVINWGDGASTSAANCSHVYSVAGTYTIVATVTDNGGATATAQQTVVVAANQPPVAKLSITPATGIVPVAVSASTAGSTDADGTIASTVINWGDGATTSAASGAHTYSTPGTYTISAMLADDRGATSTATASVTAKANQAPVAKLTLTPSTGVAPVSVTASAATSTDVDGTIASTVINWGDGTTTAAVSGSHTYSKAGTYTVTATVNDNLGASSTATAAVTVTTAPTATPGMYVTSPTAGSTVAKSVHFVANVVQSAGTTITGMRIYIDSVSKYSNTNTTKIDTYLTLTTGTRSVTIKAWDTAGHIYSTSMKITVK